MKFSALIISTLLTVVLGNPTPNRAPPAATPDPSQVWIESVTYGGTGCPQGSASIGLAIDRKPPARRPNRRIKRHLIMDKIIPTPRTYKLRLRARLREVCGVECQLSGAR